MANLTVPENVKEIPTQVREAVKKGQETVTGTVKTWSEQVGNRLPELSLPFAEALPKVVSQAKVGVNTAFDVAEQAVTRQREFVIGILDTVEARVGEAEAAAKKKPTAKKSAKAEPETTEASA